MGQHASTVATCRTMESICKNTQWCCCWSRGKAFDVCLYWAKVQPGQWLKAWVAGVPGMTRRAQFSSSESSKASHTERTGPPSIPQYLRTKQLHSDKTKQNKTLKFFFVPLECKSTSYPDARPRTVVCSLHCYHQAWVPGIYRWSGSPAGWRRGPGWLWSLVRFEGVWSDRSPMDTEGEHCGGCTGCTPHLEHPNT